MAQNLIYIVQREQQQKQPTMPKAVAQLVTALTGQQSQMPPPMQQTPLMQQTPPPQQVLPPAAQQQPDTLPLQLTGEPTVAKGMEMDAQETEVGQGNENMDDRSGAHELGSKEPTEDAEQT